MDRQEKMVGQTMIGDSLLGSAVVRTFVRRASIPIDDQDPWHHRQELPRGRCGVLFKARVLQLGELDLIKGCREIRRGGIILTRRRPPLRLRLEARRSSCRNKWLCTWQGFGSKHTLQTLHNNKRMSSAMSRTTRPASRNSCGVCLTGGRINMPIEITFCTGSSGS